MSDIASIEGYYFEDFIMQKRDNIFLYSVAKPKTTKLPQELTDCFNNIKETNRVNAYQIINDEKCQLVVERDDETGKVLRIHP